MSKTETVHTRVTPEIKNKADSIFATIGLTTSQAIMLFLTAAVNCNGMPFDLVAPSQEKQELAFATAVATVDGVKPSKEAEKLMMLYSRGDIDYETAQFALERLYKKYETINGFEVKKYEYTNHTMEKLKTIKKPADWNK